MLRPQERQQQSAIEVVEREVRRAEEQLLHLGGPPPCMVDQATTMGGDADGGPHAIEVADEDELLATICDIPDDISASQLRKRCQHSSASGDVPHASDSSVEKGTQHRPVFVSSKKSWSWDEEAFLEEN